VTGKKDKKSTQAQNKSIKACFTTIEAIVKGAMGALLPPLF
jgi:hypothetical protein